MIPHVDDAAPLQAKENAHGGGHEEQPTQEIRFKDLLADGKSGDPALGGLEEGESGDPAEGQADVNLAEGDFREAFARR